MIEELLFFYLIGSVFALAFSFILILSSIACDKSLRSKNLLKIGLHYDLFSGIYCSTRENHKYKRFIFHSIIFALFFSWIYIIMGLWGLFSYLNTRCEMPEEYKKILYKISHYHLSGIELKKMMPEIDLVFNTDLLKEYYNSEEFILKIPDDMFKETIEIKYVKKVVQLDSRFDELYKGEHYQYKIDSSEAKVFMRLIRLFNSNEDLPMVDDGVLIGDNIDQHTEISKLLEWHEVSDIKIKFFILSKYLESISKLEFRKLVRYEIERLKMGLLKIQNESELFYFRLIGNYKGFQLEGTDNLTEEQLSVYNAYFKKIRESSKITLLEIYNYKWFIYFLNEMLNRASDFYIEPQKFEINKPQK